MHQIYKDLSLFTLAYLLVLGFIQSSHLLQTVSSSEIKNESDEAQHDWFSIKNEFFSLFLLLNHKELNRVNYNINESVDKPESLAPLSSDLQSLTWNRYLGCSLWKCTLQSHSEDNDLERAVYLRRYCHFTIFWQETIWFRIIRDVRSDTWNDLQNSWA